MHVGNLGEKEPKGDFEAIWGFGGLSEFFERKRGGVILELLILVP
jgi:hypothetical protein